ncbi:MAG: hypothetical protein HQ593_03180 [Candidatus Omnitrophica bacterium]|nr:hypothetical protein [Candidatus Omnitrophota bacterium]
MRKLRVLCLVVVATIWLGSVTCYGENIVSPHTSKQDTTDVLTVSDGKPEQTEANYQIIKMSKLIEGYTLLLVGKIKDFLDSMQENMSTTKEELSR